MRLSQFRSAFSLLSLALASTRQPVASEARIPIFKPTTITQSGFYIVVRDFVSKDGPAIRILGGDVTIDLRGRTIGSPATSRVIDIAGDTVTLYLRNGTLRGSVVMDLSSGHFPHPRMIRLESLEIDAGGIMISHESSQLPIVEVRNCRLSGGGIGVFNDPGQVIARIVGNYIESGGVWLWNGSRSDVVGNTIRMAGDQGLRLSGLQNSLVRDNTITGFMKPSSTGIHVTKETSDNAQPVDSILENNQISEVAIGIAFSSLQGDLRANYSIGNVGDGIFIFDNYAIQSESIEIDSNLATGNGECGIRFSSGGGHTFRNNDVRGNGIYGIVGECGGDLGTNVDGGGNIL
jgi:parallel beta-helix repeat protein